MKSEPEDFSLEDLRNRPKQLEPWTGVRNYQARNFMRDDMQVGDKVLFYHSSVVPPGIAGLAEIASEPFPDPTAFDSKSKYFDPRAGTHGTAWVAVNVKYVETFPRLLPLEEMRRVPGLDSMLALQRGTRLSIQPVTPKEFKLVTEWIAKRPEAPAEDPKAAPAKTGAAAPAARKSPVLAGPAGRRHEAASQGHEAAKRTNQPLNQGPKTKPLPTTKGKRVAADRPE